MTSLTHNTRLGPATKNSFLEFSNKLLYRPALQSLAGRRTFWAVHLLFICVVTGCIWISRFFQYDGAWTTPNGTDDAGARAAAVSDPGAVHAGLHGQRSRLFQEQELK